MKDIENIFDSKSTQKYNPYLEMGKAIINSVIQYGIGMLPKSDIEGLIFHNICNVIEDDYSDNIHELDYVLMELLRISPSKLRTLRVNRSAKYLNNLDYNNENRLRMIRAFKHASVGWRFRSKGPQKTDDYFGVKPPKKDFIINKKGRELGSRASNFRSIATQIS